MYLGRTNLVWQNKTPILTKTSLQITAAKCCYDWQMCFSYEENFMQGHIKWNKKNLVLFLMSHPLSRNVYQRKDQRVMRNSNWGRTDNDEREKDNSQTMVDETLLIEWTPLPHWVNSQTMVDKTLLIEWTPLSQQPNNGG